MHRLATGAFLGMVGINKKMFRGDRTVSLRPV